MKTFYSLCFISLLFGCGSGGGSSSAPDTPSPVDPPEQAVCGYTDSSDGFLAENTEQLQTLLTTLANNGHDDIIYLATGTYQVTTPLTYDFATSAGQPMEKISLIGCGAEQTIFDGNGNSRVFNFWKNGSEIDEDAIHMGPNPSLYMQDLTIQNGRCIGECSDKYGNSGAGIHVQRYDTELVRVSLLNNYDLNEGSALNGSGHTTLNDVLVDGNEQGTAISVCGRLTVIDSVITNNIGGGIYRGICLDGDYSDFDVNVVRSHFEGNLGTRGYAKDHGALQVLGGTTPGELSITDSVFINNRTDSYGGAAVLTRHGNLTISNSRFIDNLVVDDHQPCTEYSMDCQTGGALFIDNWFPGGGKTLIDNSVFNNNHATDAGGAIFMGGGEDCERDLVRGYDSYCRPDDFPQPQPSQQTLTVTNSTFNGNQAAKAADVIIAKMELQGGFQSGNVTLEASSFSNSAGNSSMVIGGNLTLSETAIGNSVHLAGELSSDNLSSIESLIQR